MTRSNIKQIRQVLDTQGYVEATKLHPNTLRALRNAGYYCEIIGYDLKGFDVYNIEQTFKTINRNKIA